jgi:predicted MFS family arabinose efflux permease
VRTEGLPPRFWWYLAAAALVAAGFADFPLIAFRFSETGVVSAPDVPLLYALAMGVSGAASLAFGRLFDRSGLRILVPLTIVTAAFAPLVFLGDAGPVVVGVALWGVGMGVHESIIPAAVATMVPVARRASAYGLFTAGYGIAWFAGSALMGFLYDVSFPLMIVLSVGLELAAVPLLLRVARPAST